MHRKWASACVFKRCVQQWGSITIMHAQTSARDPAPWSCKLSTCRMGLTRLEIHVLPHNAPSRQLAERLGFTQQVHYQLTVAYQALLQWGMEEREDSALCCKAVAMLHEAISNQSRGHA